MLDERSKGWLSPIHDLKLVYKPIFREILEKSQDSGRNFIQIRDAVGGVGWEAARGDRGDARKQ